MSTSVGTTWAIAGAVVAASIVVAVAATPGIGAFGEEHERAENAAGAVAPVAGPVGQIPAATVPGAQDVTGLALVRAEGAPAAGQPGAQAAQAAGVPGTADPRLAAAEAPRDAARYDDDDDDEHEEHDRHEEREHGSSSLLRLFSREHR